jgi:hypothetical protein
MEILIGDLVGKIKQTFDSTKVLSVESVYEKNSTSDEYKLVISMNKILYDDVNVIYSKLLFITDINKTKLIKNYFTYLYDINCQYVRVEFNSLNNFASKLTDIFNNNKFGDNIKILSKFVKSPSTLINTWFDDNNILDLSVVNVKEEKIDIMPCKSLFFDFTIDLNNNQSVKLKITKEKDDEYIFTFDILGDKHEVKQSGLDKLVETIGDNLKNKVKV